MNQEGGILTTTAAMMQELSRHCGRVFQGRPPQDEDVEAWGRQAFPEDDLLRTPAAKWQLRQWDIARAIKTSGHSAAGPDPQAAWRALTRRQLGGQRATWPSRP